MGVAPAAVTFAGSLTVLTVSAGLALTGAGVLGAVSAAHAPAGGAAAATAAYAIPLALLTAVSGRLADRVGADRLLRAGLLALAATSALAALAWNLPSLLVLRALQGAAAGLLPATALALLLRTAPRERFAEVVGIFAGGALLLPAAAPLLGAALADRAGWRPLLLATVPVALLAARGSIGVLPRSARGERERGDRVGMLTGAAGLGLTLLALAGGPSWGWGAPRTVLLGLAGLGALGVFAVVELSTDDPIVDLDALREPRATAPWLLLVVLVACLSAGFLEAPGLLDQAQGGGPPATWMALLGGLCIAVALPAGGRLGDRHGPRWPAAAGLSLVANATYLLHLTGPATAGWEVAALVVMRGAGIGLALAPVTAAVLLGTDSGVENRACAAIATVLRLPVALGVAVLASLAVAPRAVRPATLDIASLASPVAWAPLRAALLVTAGVSALGVLLALRLDTVERPEGSRIDLSRMLAVLTGSSRRSISLVGLVTRRPPAPEPAPAAPRTRRAAAGATRSRAAAATSPLPRTRTATPRTATTRAATARTATPRTATTRTVTTRTVTTTKPRTRSTTATTGTASSRTPAAPSTATPARTPRTRRTGAAAELPAEPTAAVPSPRRRAPRPAPASEAATATPAPAPPKRRAPARSATSSTRRRTVETDPPA